jgi:aldose 1-epimerase
MIVSRARTDACRETWMGEPVARLSAAGWTAMIVPRIGGTLVSLRHEERGLDVLNAPPDPRTFEKRPRIYGIPVLFPPNRIRDGVFHLDYRTYRLPINSPEANHCHGLIGLLPWTVDELCVEGEEAVAVVSRREAPGSEFFAVFPHEMVVSNTYRLSVRGLEQTVSVTNRGASPMPVGVGLHCAFRVPFVSSTPPAAVRLRVSVGRRWELDARSLPTESLLSLSAIEEGYRKGGLPAQGFPIRDHYTMDPIEVDGASFHGAVLEDATAGLRVLYEVGPLFGHWMIWNENGNGGFVCPEPMSWAIDAPNLRMDPALTGMRILAPGEQWREKLSVRVQDLSL